MTSMSLPNYDEDGLDESLESVRQEMEDILRELEALNHPRATKSEKEAHTLPNPLELKKQQELRQRLAFQVAQLERGLTVLDEALDRGRDQLFRICEDRQQLHLNRTAQGYREAERLQTRYLETLTEQRATIDALVTRAKRILGNGDRSSSPTVTSVSWTKAPKWTAALETLWSSGPLPDRKETLP